MIKFPHWCIQLFNLGLCAMKKYAPKRKLSQDDTVFKTYKQTFPPKIHGCYTQRLVNCNEPKTRSKYKTLFSYPQQ